MPEGEIKTHRGRSPVFRHQFAGSIVDGRDVIGIEGMPHTEHVGEQGEADSKDAATHQIVGRHDQREQCAESDDVQGQYQQQWLEAPAQHAE